MSRLYPSWMLYICAPESPITNNEMVTVIKESAVSQRSQLLEGDKRRKSSAAHIPMEKCIELKCQHRQSFTTSTSIYWNTGSFTSQRYSNCNQFCADFELACSDSQFKEFLKWQRSNGQQEELQSGSVNTVISRPCKKNMAVLWITSRGIKKPSVMEPLTWKANSSRCRSLCIIKPTQHTLGYIYILGNYNMWN